ncbi:hypothetical protein CONCODRAFT_12932 [Conidiobolus coronatus NRRL 28638]|uniref:Uncharacterized protein n=1 Tax=Conidiobolus coronatus (strain ATCC 28846 / CBS 209.66 / NRRL 28638) TaxID=796925 RepID=A0A137NRW5_CONC2|nr:hypothetical protein CONCODRAFT_12932 [Conidiobolus coronatus NRRL 28638]|eukprot:KXN65464.1 hypothetical protein CONCODRAFT_12932 [Conidiobolus coronatus NRRL 28638]
MFEKYNFNSVLILSTLLTFIVGFCITEDYKTHSISYPISVFALQLTSIGIYCAFIQNEFFKAHILYQVFAVALVTGYQGGRSIEHVLKQGLNIDFNYANVGWALTAVALYSKLPELVVKCIRFDIGYAISFILVQNIEALSSYNELISAIVGFGFIAINRLNFEKVSFITTIYCYAHMIVFGIETLIKQLPLGLDQSYILTILSNISIVLVMIAAKYSHFSQKSGKDQSVATSEVAYSTF